MPQTEKDIFDLIGKAKRDGGSRACLEFIRSQFGMGVRSIFTFGWGYGGLRMAMTAHQIPFEEVTPVRWQTDLRCLSKGNKNVTKAKAQQLEPNAPWTHATADSFLIATWCTQFSRFRRKDLKKPRVSLL